MLKYDSMQGMTGLILDTSTDQSLLALVDEKKILQLAPIPEGNQLSKHLPPAIKKLLDERSKPLSYIAVGIGPGTFTGTRVGVALAKSLAFSLELPLIGFCSDLIQDRTALPAFLHKKWQEGAYHPEQKLELRYIPNVTQKSDFRLGQSLGNQRS